TTTGPRNGQKRAQTDTDVAMPVAIVQHLAERFPRDTADAVWLRALAAEGNWVVVSGDLRITRNPTEREAWLKSGLVAFFLGKGWGSIGFWEHAWKLVQLSDLGAVMLGQTFPWIVLVTRSSSCSRAWGS